MLNAIYSSCIVPICIVHLFGMILVKEQWKNIKIAYNNSLRRLLSLPKHVRKQISVRAIRRIKDDAIVKDLDKFSIDQRCVDVDTMVEMYDRFLSELLDKHAPLKKITVVDRPLNEWMTNNILALKAIRRKNELNWRKTRITINFNIYYDSCMAVKKAISIRKAELMEQKVINCEGDQKKLFSLIHSLFGSKKYHSVARIY